MHGSIMRTKRRRSGDSCPHTNDTSCLQGHGGGGAVLAARAATCSAAPAPPRAVRTLPAQAAARPRASAAATALRRGSPAWGGMRFPSWRAVRRRKAARCQVPPRRLAHFWDQRGPAARHCVHVLSCKKSICHMAVFGRGGKPYSFIAGDQPPRAE